VLSNSYVLTTIAIALVLGACWLRSGGRSPAGGSDEALYPPSCAGSGLARRSLKASNWPVPNLDGGVR